MYVSKYDDLPKPLPETSLLAILTDQLYQRIRAYKLTRDSWTLAEIGEIADEIKALGFRPMWFPKVHALATSRVAQTNVESNLMEVQIVDEA